MRNNPVLQRIGPFLGLGIAIVMMVFAMVIAGYLLFWGLLIGSILYIISMFKQVIFGPKQKPTPAPTPKVEYRTFDQTTGRWE